MRIRPNLTPASRLVVAADFKPGKCGGRKGVRKKVIDLATALHGSGVVIKVNTIVRAVGYDLLDEIADLGLVPFADIKLSDTGDTDESDFEFLAECKAPRMLVTVKCDSGPTTLARLAAKLPERFETIGITVLSDMTEDDCMAVFGRSLRGAICDFAVMARETGLGGIVCSGRDAGFIRQHPQMDLPGGYSLSVNTPNIRPAGLPVEGDGQNLKRSATIAEAFDLQSDRVIIGRPITQHAEPLVAVRMCLEEVEAYFATHPVA